MELQEARQKFINSWGVLASNWGINRTMSQIHALLLVTHQPISAEEIMETLKVSRGNVNMNVRALMDWGLVEKAYVPGERKEYFEADKNVESFTRKIVAHRKSKEIVPVIELLNDLQQVDVSKEKDQKNAQAFKTVLTDLAAFSKNVDKVMDVFVKSDKNWIVSLMRKLF